MWHNNSLLTENQYLQPGLLNKGSKFPQPGIVQSFPSDNYYGRWMGGKMVIIKYSKTE